MYHSTATLTPNATIMIAGSNPNLDVSTVKYATEYRVEWLTPSYLNLPRPTYTGLPATIGYGTQFTLQMTLPPNTTGVTGACLYYCYHSGLCKLIVYLVTCVFSVADGLWILNSRGANGPTACSAELDIIWDVPHYQCTSKLDGIPTRTGVFVRANGRWGAELWPQDDDWDRGFSPGGYGCYCEVSRDARTPFACDAELMGFRSMLAVTNGPTLEALAQFQPLTGEGSRIPTAPIPVPP